MQAVQAVHTWASEGRSNTQEWGSSQAEQWQADRVAMCTRRRDPKGPHTLFE